MRKNYLAVLVTGWLMSWTPLAAQDTLFYENFSSGQLPSTISLVNVDGLTPDDPDLVGLADSAWAIRFISAQDFPSGYSAFSVSFYVDDEGPSDDWMILPGLVLGDSTVLSWTAMAITSSGDFRDRYQVFAATDTSLATFALNAPLFDTGPLGEIDSPQFRSILINDSATYLTVGDTFYLAFRNLTQPFDADQPIGPGNGGNELAIDSIVVTAKATATHITAPASAASLTLLSNPVQGTLRLSLSIQQGDVVSLQLMDLQGRILRQLPAQTFGRGSHRLTLPLDGVSAGTYLLQARGQKTLTSTRVWVRP
jgi:hypothetical protein